MTQLRNLLSLRFRKHLRQGSADRSQPREGDAEEKDDEEGMGETDAKPAETGNEAGSDFFASPLSFRADGKINKPEYELKDRSHQDQPKNHDDDSQSHENEGLDGRISDRARNDNSRKLGNELVHKSGNRSIDGGDLHGTDRKFIDLGNVRSHEDAYKHGT